MAAGGSSLTVAPCANGCGQPAAERKGVRGRWPIYCEECGRVRLAESRARAVARAGGKYRGRYKEYERAYRADPRNKAIKAKRKRVLHLEKLYGLTLGAYEQMLREQGGVCAICKGPPSGPGGRLHVDHDHFTDQVRALLCGRCNSALGLLEEDTARMETMIEYIKRSGGEG